MQATPFLTQLDSRAAIKGSRDPLGVQALWSRFGRHLVGNLTTVSNSVRDFTVLLLGYYFAERVADEGGTQGDLATFLKWEQLAAYARARVNKERGFRGTERVVARLNDSDRVRLGTDGSSQILGNQRIYGLWGLYSVPAKASGLLDGDPARLTPPARELVERVHLPIFAEVGLGDGRAIVERLRGVDYTIDFREHSKDAPLLAAVARILARLRVREREIYREYLLYGGPADASAARGTRGVQREFADVLAETFDDRGWRLTPQSIATLARRARGRGGVGEELASRLERARTCELLIAPAVAFFEYALGCDGQTPAQIAAAVHAHWGETPRGTIDVDATEALEPELRAWADDTESGRRWLRLAHALHSGSYEEALYVVLEQNAAVMKARSAAAPWALVREGKLHVRFRDEQLTDLPEAQQLPLYWRHAYFIESLRSVALALRG
jgi:hypothetical protein